MWRLGEAEAASVKVSGKGAPGKGRPQRSAAGRPVARTDSSFRGGAGTRLVFSRARDPTGLFSAGRGIPVWLGFTNIWGKCHKSSRRPGRLAGRPRARRVGPGEKNRRQEF